MPKPEPIDWVMIPEFTLINEGMNFNTFRCSKYGKCILAGKIAVEFPEGWVTDITSSPSWLRSIIPQLGPHAPAAILHDRLLSLGHTRSYSRFWLRKHLHSLRKVKRSRRFAIWAGVLIWDVFFARDSVRNC